MGAATDTILGESFNIQIQEQIIDVIPFNQVIQWQYFDNFHRYFVMAVNSSADRWLVYDWFPFDIFWLYDEPRHQLTDLRLRAYRGRDHLVARDHVKAVWRDDDRFVMLAARGVIEVNTVTMTERTLISADELNLFPATVNATFISPDGRLLVVARNGHRETQNGAEILVVRLPD